MTPNHSVNKPYLIIEVKINVHACHLTLKSVPGHFTAQISFLPLSALSLMGPLARYNYNQSLDWYPSNIVIGTYDLGGLALPLRSPTAHS